jgi:hypothetical protein
MACTQGERCKHSFLAYRIKANLNPTWGISQFTVSANQVDMQFVGTSGGTFTDNLTLGG